MGEEEADSFQKKQVRKRARFLCYTYNSHSFSFPKELLSVNLEN